MQQERIKCDLVLLKTIQMIARIQLNRMLRHDDRRRGSDARVAEANGQAHGARGTLQNRAATPRQTARKLGWIGYELRSNFLPRGQQSVVQITHLSVTGRAVGRSRAVDGVVDPYDGDAVYRGAFR